MIYILNQLRNTSYPIPDDAVIYYKKWPTEDCPFSISFDATPNILGAAKREYHLGYYWNEDKVKAIMTLINGRRGQPGAYYVMPEEEDSPERITLCRKKRRQKKIEMSEKFDYDFSGWATRNNVKCSDGRTIKRDAFAGDDGKTVPLVLEFNHQDVTNVLGKALLCNRPEGVYMYGKFNDTRKGQIAKAMVQLGDITSLGIYAIGIKHDGMNVIGGSIKEVSLVAAPANPGAIIDYVVPSTNEHGGIRE